MSFTGTKVFTGAVPFRDKPSHAVMSTVVGGGRPSRPTHPALTVKLWTLTQQCWDQDAHRRPSALRIACSLYVLTGNEIYLG